MELRPGAPGDVRAPLLFVVQPPDTAVLAGQALLSGLITPGLPGGAGAGYQPVAVAKLAGLSGDTASGAAFVSDDADTFLDEFFPGAETEVEIGAGALVARNRAHTLAEARQRMRLTQAQVADRMNVPTRKGCRLSSAPSRGPPRSACLRPTRAPSAAAWRSSLTSAASASC